MVKEPLMTVLQVDPCQQLRRRRRRCLSAPWPPSSDGYSPKRISHGSLDAKSSMGACYPHSVKRGVSESSYLASLNKSLLNKKSDVAPILKRGLRFSWGEIASCNSMQYIWLLRCPEHQKARRQSNITRASFRRRESPTVHARPMPKNGEPNESASRQFQNKTSE